MSTLMYGSECWTISSEMEKKLEAMEMWCYRRMLRLSWTRKVTNEEVLKRVGEGRTLMKRIRKRQLEFFRTHREKREIRKSYCDRKNRGEEK